MSEQIQFDLIKQTFNAHLEAVSPLTGNTVIGGVDVLDLESHICGLIATFIGYEGDIEKINAHYQGFGSIDDYSTMVRLSQSALKGVVLDMPKGQGEYLMNVFDVSRRVMEILETQESFNPTQTADLDEELTEFRKILAQNKIEEKESK